MKTAIKTIIAVVLFTLGTSAAWAGKGADPFLMKFTADKLEIGNDADNTKAWEVDLWAGKDWHKLWLYSEGESANGQTESENMLVYSTPIAPFWDFQVGAARDEKSDASYNWAAIGFNGLAPYYFETQAHLLVGESGVTGIRASFEYEALFTQFLILTPEVEVTAYSSDIEKLGIGSGLSSLKLGLRLRYEIKREIAPYIGVQWSQTYGQTADYRKADGEETGDTTLVAGIRIWF
jgi:copper resistance protein B